MSEVRRAVHLMKRGFQKQKSSVSESLLSQIFQVISNLDRIMTETGSNEELFALIIVSETLFNACSELIGKLGLKFANRVCLVLHQAPRKRPH
jgi:molecular chaperone GrpE (heat shock protein)